MDEVSEYKIDLMIFSAIWFIMLFALFVIGSLHLKLLLPGYLIIPLMLTLVIGGLHSGFVAIDSLFQIIRLNKEKAGGQ